MANTKKIRSEKKKAKTFSIQNKHLDVFLDICDVTGAIPSNKIEELIITFNKSYNEN